MGSCDSCDYAKATRKPTYGDHHLFLLKSKDGTLDAYRRYEAWLETQFNVRIKRLRSDRGGEYVHDTPEHNGVAERLNRTLIERVRAMLHASGLPKSLWGEAIAHAVWLKNRTSTRALGTKTPYEMLYKSRPDLSNLPVWGSRVKVHTTDGSKLDMRAKDGRWVGYDKDSNGHRIYYEDTRRVGVERSIKSDTAEVEVPLSAPLEGEQGTEVPSSQL